MKKLYTLAALFMLSVTSAFAQADLAILHNVQNGDTIEIATTNPPQYVFAYAFVNHGPNALTQTDTLFLSTPYTVFKLTLPPAGLPATDTVYFYDTTGFNQGPATGPSQWCDSIWAKNSSNAIIADPVMANNKLCNSIYILNTPVSISEKLGGSKGSTTASLNVYPNPAVSSVSFDYYSNSYNEATMIVTDITGRKVYQENLGNVNGAQKATINVNNFSNGLYIVELRVGNTKQVGKFSVQK